MERIASFTVDHTVLEPGVYVSRLDRDPHTGSAVTTFDLRMTKPNVEPVLTTAAAHAIEHLGATFLRNHPTWASLVVYFGPMGCRTGFYLILFGEHRSQDIAPLIEELYAFITSFEGEIPGASAVECGNYRDMNLAEAKRAAERYLTSTLRQIDEAHLTYPATTSSLGK